MRFIVVLLVVCAVVSGFGMDFSRGLNVKDFGAKGDGVADDTIAIQKALNFLRTTNNRILLARYPMLAGAPELGELPLLGSTGENVLVPELFFPAGNYKISETLVGATYLYLRGEQGSIIIQSAPDKDLLYISWGFRIQMRDLTFSGGRRHVVLWTGNEDTANVTFENCRFEKSSGTAFYSYNFLNPKRTNYSNTSYGSYSVKWDGEKPVLTPNNENEKTCPNSTLFTFLNCDFIDCREIFRFNGDGAVIENCRIQMPANAEPFPMHLRAAVRIINLQATTLEAIPGGAWINGHGTIMIEDSSFNVEKGNGMSLFNVDLPKRLELLCCLMVRNTKFFSPEAPLIYNKNNMLNVAELINVTNSSGKTVNMMEWAKIPTAESLKASNYDISPAVNAIPGSKDAFTFPYSFTFSNCRGISTANMPLFLKRAFEQPLPEKGFFYVL